MRKIAIALLLTICGWTVLWAVAAHEAGRQFDAWLAAEAAQGRDWTCPSRVIAGYPLTLSVACTDATFRGQALGQSVQGAVAALTAVASVAHPRSLALDLTAPFTYRSSNGATDLRGRWTNLHLDLAGLPTIESVALTGSDIAVDGLFGPAGQQHLASTQLDARIMVPMGGSDPGLDFDIAVAGTAVPQIDALLGDTQPTDLHVVGQIDRTDIGDVRTPEEAMDRWRRAGGHIDLRGSTIDRGSSRVTATGTLRLDAAHRPQGHLDAQFLGLEPILKRYGINANLAAAGALLSTLFGSPQRQAPPAPGAIALPINLQDGHIGIGPIRTDITLNPVY